MVKQITSYRFARPFKKQYQALPKEIRRAFNEKLEIFLADMLHPSLRVKKIKGTTQRWEGSVTMKYRFTFQIGNDTVVFRAIGTHDILSRE